MVHDAGNSDPEYQNASAVVVPVAVNIPNASPEFDRDQRSRNIDENTGLCDPRLPAPPLGRRLWRKMKTMTMQSI